MRASGDEKSERKGEERKASSQEFPIHPRSFITFFFYFPLSLFLSLFLTIAPAAMQALLLAVLLAVGATAGTFFL